jgi:Fe-S-cluster-containing hydrogenase component 2
MDPHKLPVVDAVKCTACGDCVDVCPKELFSIQPISHQLWVNCKNLEHGEPVLEECEVGCTACEKCVFDAPQGLIEMVNNLPRIDYSQNHNAKMAIERCPTGSIVWFNKDQVIERGRESKKIVRKSDRRIGTS